MQKSTAPGSSFDESDPQQPGGAPTMGDADAVQKTTWVVGKGTDDRAPDPIDATTDADSVGSERDPSPRRAPSGDGE